MVGQEHKGLAGIEYVLERDLQAHNGRLETYRDAARRPMWVPPSGFEPGMDGRDVRLSIDLVVQRYAESRLTQAIKELGAAGGRLIVINPETGAIVTVAEVQTHGPDAPTQQRLHRVRSVSDPYEPGSTFKIYPYAAALSAGFKPEHKFHDAPRCWDNYCPKNFGDKYLGKVSLSDEFKNSLNTIAVELLDN